MSRGIARERAVRVLLEDEGWWTARAAGSKGDADVVALKAGHVPMMVEVKSTSRSAFAGFGPADRADLIAAAVRAGAEAWLVWWPVRRKPRWIPASEWPEIRTKEAA